MKNYTAREIPTHQNCLWAFKLALSKWATSFFPHVLKWAAGSASFNGLWTNDLPAAILQFVHGAERDVSENSCRPLWCRAHLLQVQHTRCSIYLAHRVISINQQRPLFSPCSCYPIRMSIRKVVGYNGLMPDSMTLEWILQPLMNW